LSDRCALYHTAPRLITEFWLDLWFTRTVLLLDKSGFNCVLRCLSEAGPLAGAFVWFGGSPVTLQERRSTKPDKLTPTKAKAN